jgi:hypothetical protein
MEEQEQGTSTESAQDAATAESNDFGSLMDSIPLAEDLGDEPTGEPPDEHADEREAEQPPEQAPQGVTDETEIELGNGRKITVKEAKDSFETFTQKTEELGRVKRDTLAQAREAVARVTEQRAQEMHLLSQQLERLVAPGIDDQTLMAMAHSDPQQFFAHKARLDAARQFQQQIGHQAQQLMQQAHEQRQLAATEANDAHQQLLARESQKLTGQKWWNEDFQRQAVAYAKKHGIPNEIASGVSYAGFVEITRKAMLYDEAMTRAKSGKVAQAQPRPGVKQPARAPARELDALYQSAVKSKDGRGFGKWLEAALPKA